MANEFRLQVKNVEEYEHYSITQLQETLEHFNQMINEIRVERLMVEDVLRGKYSMAHPKFTPLSYAELSKPTQQQLLQVIGLDSVPSLEKVNS